MNDQILCKSVHEIRSYRAIKRVFALLPRKVDQGHSSLNSFKAMVGGITGSNCV